MRGARQVEAMWLELLSRVRRSGMLETRPVEPGYDLVVRRGEADSSSPRGDLSALEEIVPNLARTRAVYLNSQAEVGWPGLPTLRDWAGTIAEPIESGAVRAFAVVDPEKFRERVAETLRQQGWRVEHADAELRVRNGVFTERVNLVREIVRMVHLRQGMKEAAAAVANRLKAAFVREAAFYVRFERRFRDFDPDVYDHYFVAYPSGCCLAFGWDYWQLAELSDGEAEMRFAKGAEDFERLLPVARDGLPSSGRGTVCGRA
jgi:hypothetical protein